MNSTDQTEQDLKISIETRNLEIELFWKRSLFFWGFIASAFAGYATLRSDQPELALLVACFGMVCSFAWTLLNRGSKYWQENWESKVSALEVDTGRDLFSTTAAVQKDKGFWLRAREYSPSKLTIALSDYVCAAWFAIVLGEIARHVLPLSCKSCTRTIGATLFCLFSFCYVPLLLVFGRRSARR